MKPSALEKALREHYRQQRLPEAARRDLINRVRREGRRPWPVKWVASTAAAALLLVVAVMLVVNYGPSRDPGSAISAEVVENHLRDLPPDFVVDSFESAARHMDKLNFMPRSPGQLVPGNARLVGSRYCTIQGGVAAQYRLQLPDGQVLTLYQSRAQPSWATLDGLQASHAGIPVRFRVSDGLVSVLAGDAGTGGD